VVCDHSKSAFYANGLTEEKVFLQKKEIADVSGKFGIKVFHGIESDILKEGELDYDEDFLNNFDFVVASIHSRFQMSENEMTARIIKAVENPHTNILGHPTGRLLLRRDGYKIDIIKIIDACVANKVAIEINSHPQRLDLDWRNIYYARNKGCMFSINPDAHSVHEIDLIKYGISIARKGGIQPDEVLNCLPINEFQDYLKEREK
ncbi:MAG: PHP domain-containing protein, partial [Ignavibacteriales bacterium]